MTRQELYNIRYAKAHKIPYRMINYNDFDFSLLTRLIMRDRRPAKENEDFNDCIIMLDTETSKSEPNSIDKDNYIVAFTLSIRAFDTNLVTLWGSNPWEAVKCVFDVHEAMTGNKTVMYVHNLAYDWVFLRKFMFEIFGRPIRQLNTKPHYPIMIEFSNGLILKDSLILAQRSLEKWAKDLNVENKKAVGCWDYDKIRNQNEAFTADELTYIEHDTLAGVECLQKMKDTLGKHIYNMPYTATGIPREESRRRGKDNYAKDYYKSVCLSYLDYCMAEACYHGGFTHGNRWFINTIMGTKDNPVRCFDFASSYPFVMLSEKYPAEKFSECCDLKIDDILEDQEAVYMCRLVATGVSLKDKRWPMPALQFSKAVKIINPVLDNGRVLKCDYISINLTSVDLQVIKEQYNFEHHICTNCLRAYATYLPRWFTDYVYECFKDKTQLKGGDAVLYQLAKAKLNSLYGMCVQKNIRETINENYETGEYYVEEGQDPEELYQKFTESRGSILPYQWGVFVTSYAFRNLFELGKCAGLWLYSDTDSCYGLDWDMGKLEAYNARCREKLLANNYGPVLREGDTHEYWLGIAEPDAVYTEFKVQGAKRYCGRSAEDGKLHITVAGVPKKGAAALEDDINNFQRGFIFRGTVTGKKQHTYLNSEIKQDEKGNYIADSIDLSPCDYLLDSIENQAWDDFITEEVSIIDYEDTE